MKPKKWGGGKKHYGLLNSPGLKTSSPTTNNSGGWVAKSCYMRYQVYATMQVSRA